MMQVDTLDNLPIAIITTDEAKVTPINGSTGYWLKIPVIIDVVIVEYRGREFV